jgi:hypothetical protein
MRSLIFKVLPLVQVKADGSPINIRTIADICVTGLEDCPPEDRAIAWLLLSGVLPASPEDWPRSRASTLNEYSAFVSLFQLEGHESKMFENSTSVMEFGVPDNSLMELIHDDVVRTGHHIQLFPGADSAVAAPADDPLLPFHVHLRRLERILYIFAKCNPTMSYAQGFNEIVSVLYCVFAQALNWFYDDWLALESCVFYTFQQMFSATRLSELFNTDDNSALILSSMTDLMDVMERHLPRVAAIVRRHNIHPVHFCYRKMNLLFSQDQQIPGLVLIWDALFSHFYELIDYEQYLVIAVFKFVEELLDPNDYSQTMVVLQKIVGCANNPKKLIDTANQFWNADHPSG